MLQDKLKKNVARITGPLRIIQEYFQPEIGRKIRIFSLGRKNSILIYIYKKECILDIILGVKYLRTKCRYLQTVKGVLFSYGILCDTPKKNQGVKI